MYNVMSLSWGCQEGDLNSLSSLGLLEFSFLLDSLSCAGVPGCLRDRRLVMRRKTNALWALLMNRVCLHVVYNVCKIYSTTS